MPPYPTTYRETRDLLGNPDVFPGYSPFEKAKIAKRFTGDPTAFSQADSFADVLFKSTPDFIDRQLETKAPWLLDKSGDLFESVATSLGASEGVGREVGRQLPAGLVDYLPMLAGSAIAPGPGTIAGLGATALMTAMRSYKDTDSPSQAMMTGALSGVGLPLASHLGGKVATGLLQKALPKAGDLAHKAASYAGGQVAGLGTEFASDAMQTKMATGSFDDVFSKDFLIASAISELPFAVADIPRGLRAIAPKLSASVSQDSRVQNTGVDKTVLEDRQEALAIPITPPLSSDPVRTGAELTLNRIAQNISILAEKEKDFLLGLDDGTRQAYDETTKKLFQNVQSDLSELTNLDLSSANEDTLLTLSSLTSNQIFDQVFERNDLDPTLDRIQNSLEALYEKNKKSVTEGYSSKKFFDDEQIHNFYTGLGGKEQDLTDEHLGMLHGLNIPETLTEFNGLLQSVNLPLIHPTDSQRVLLRPRPGDSFLASLLHLQNENRIRDGLTMPRDDDGFEADAIPNIPNVHVTDATLKPKLEREVNTLNQTLEEATRNVKENVQAETDNYVKFFNETPTAINPSEFRKLVDRMDPLKDPVEERLRQGKALTAILEEHYERLERFAKRNGVTVTNSNAAFQENRELLKAGDPAGNPTLVYMPDANILRAQVHDRTRETKVNYARLSSDKIPEFNEIYAETIAAINAAKGLEDFAQIPSEIVAPYQTATMSADEMLTQIGISEGLNSSGVFLLKNLYDKLRTLVPTNVEAFGLLKPLLAGADITQLGLAKATVDGVKNVFLGPVKDLKKFSPQQLVNTHTFVLGHELYHGVDHDWKQGRLQGEVADRWEEFVNWSETAEQEDIQDLLDSLVQMIPKDMQENEHVLGLLKNTSGDELRANVGSLWAMSVLGKDTRLGMPFLPSAPRRALSALTTLARRIVKSFKRMFGGESQLTRIERLFETLQKEAMKSEEDIAEFSKLGQITPQRVLNMNQPVEGGQQIRELMNFALFAPKEANGDLLLPKRSATKAFLRAASYVSEKPQQLVRRIPALKPLFEPVVNFNRNVTNAMTQVMSHLGVVNALGGVELAKNQELVLDSPRLNKEVSDVMRKFNQSGAKLVEEDLTSTEGVVKALGKQSGKDRNHWESLSEEDRQIVGESVARHMKAATERDAQLAQAELKVGKFTLAKFLGKMSKDLSRAEMMEVSEKIIAANEMMVDPASPDYAKGQTLLDEVGSFFIEKNSLKDFTALNSIAKLVTGRYQKLKALFESEPAKFSTRQMGKYKLTYVTTKGDSIYPGALVFGKRKDMEVAREKLAKEGKHNFVEHEATKQIGGTFTVDPARDSYFEQLDQEAKEFVESLNLGDETRDLVLEFFTTTGEYRKQARLQQAEGAMLENLIKPFSGQELIDMPRNFMLDSDLTVRAIQNRLLDAELSWARSDPELIKHPKEVAQLNQNILNFKYPDTPVGKSLLKGIFAYFLGFNVSSHFMEMTQAAFSVAPQMNAEGFQSLETAKILKDSFKKTAKLNYYLVKKGKELKDLQEARKLGILDETEVAVMEQLTRDNLIAIGPVVDIQDSSFTSSVQQAYLAKTGKKINVGEAISKPISAYYNLSTRMYGAFTHTNARVSGLAYVDMFRKQHPGEPTFVKDVKGKKVLNPKLIDGAREFVRTTNFTGGKADRSTLLYSGHTPALRTIGMALGPLRGYTESMLSEMFRYAQHGFFGEGLNITPKQREDARRAFRNLMIVSASASGALGMPFVPLILAELEKNTDLDVEGSVRVALDEFFNADGDTGFISDIALDGWFNTLAGGVGIPVDLSSRFSFGTPIGTDQFNGISTQGLAGPTGAAARSIIQGQSALRQGKAGQALEDFAPVAWKKLIHTIRNENQVIDRFGNKVADLDGAESFAMALGFTPQNVKRSRDRHKITERIREIQRKKDIAFFDNLAEVYLEDPLTAAQKVQELPESERQAGIKKIAERVERRTYPADPRSEAPLSTSEKESRLFKALPVEGSTSEVDRLKLRLQVEKSLMGSMHDVEPRFQEAVAIDQIMNFQSVTKQQAKEILHSQKIPSKASLKAFQGIQSPFF